MQRGLDDFAYNNIVLNSKEHYFPSWLGSLLTSAKTEVEKGLW